MWQESPQQEEGQLSMGGVRQRGLLIGAISRSRISKSSYGSHEKKTLETLSSVPSLEGETPFPSVGE